MSAEWRNGVHLQDTPIWCDARRPRDVCFISHAHADGVPRHGQLIATAATLALLGPEAGGRDARLAVPYGRPFTLGQVRLELLRSGVGAGSAGLLADVRGRRILYMGAVDADGGGAGVGADAGEAARGLGGTAEARACDTLIVSASYGRRECVFPARAEAAAKALAFARETVAGGGVAALLVSSPTKALDVAAYLAARDPALPLLAHRAMATASQRLRTVEADAPRLRAWSSKRAEPAVLLWPLRARESLGALPAGSRAALVSGRAADAGALRELGVDTGFAWSDRADYPALLAYVERVGASEVLLASAQGDELAEDLHAPGRVVRMLRPPQQMALFGA
ncbi:hypothetical protein [Haliangium ochraceum]|uniref:Uncharacterized protein n=1 Tax=Haliangium ochraceum (strain DSM 14365 / JCM 11303 / SMP-2) TaxID=502025 RepID=D0LGC2_HALO1|nr:hypothetical protein [Haliangium ochraceum]ACY18147.1 conserved hypothetical protein [Haliangium ochraceum DSM 14365]